MVVRSDPAPPPPAFLQLVGHPLRWGLLGELAQSDRTVGELTDRVSEPQNLVSYHLGKLRDGGLVRARRSSADRRDAYYSVDLRRVGELLAGTGTALHPGLRLAPPPPSRWTSGVPSPRVLFLCTGNSARSQMAEALTRARSGGVVHADSAGSNPKPLHPNAVRAMREVHGIDLRTHRPKHLDELAGERFDRVVTLCDRVREVCPEFRGHPVAVHWSLPDPSVGPAEGDGGGNDATYPAFLLAATEIETRVGFLLATLAPPPPSPNQHQEEP